VPVASDSGGESRRALARAMLILGSVLVAGTALAGPPQGPDAGAAISNMYLFEGPNRQRTPLMDGAEMVELMKKSSTHYVVTEAGGKECSDVAIAEFPGLMWPAKGGEIPTPTWAVDADGGSFVRPYQQSDAARTLFKQGEERFLESKYDEAIVFYRKALSISPHDYLALLALGDCAFRQGFLTDALELYQRAEAEDPADSRSYFFQATIFTAQGQVERALDAYADALVRSPRRVTLHQGIQARSKQLGVTIADERFHPLTLARRKGDTIQICIASPTPHWIAYGLCKAIWLGEPDHRRALSGSTELRFDSTAEWECLANLLARYRAERKAGETPPEPELERLDAVVEANMSDEFILFELATRVVPQAALLVSSDTRRRLKAYVRRFVLERTTGGADAGP
jgi:tetratricopeptide (TPR) repeat protein